MVWWETSWPPRRCVRLSNRSQHQSESCPAALTTQAYPLSKLWLHRIFPTDALPKARVRSCDPARIRQSHLAIAIHLSLDRRSASMTAIAQVTAPSHDSLDLAHENESDGAIRLIRNYIQGLRSLFLTEAQLATDSAR